MDSVDPQNYDIVERTESRMTRFRFGMAEEIRDYIINIKALAPTTTVIAPHMALQMGRYPNPGGRRQNFTPVIGMQHPDAYEGLLLYEGSKSLMRLDEVIPEWERSDCVRSIRVRLIWRNVPDPAMPIWSRDSSLTSEQTRWDINLKPIRGPNGESITVPRQLSQGVEHVLVRWVENKPDALSRIEQCEGKTNATFWRRHDCGKWLFIGSRIEPVDDEHADIEYAFQLNPLGWDTELLHLGEDGEPLLVSPGFPVVTKVPLYHHVDFKVLPGLETEPTSGCLNETGCCCFDNAALGQMTIEECYEIPGAEWTAGPCDGWTCA